LEQAQLSTETILPCFHWFFCLLFLVYFDYYIVLLVYIFGSLLELSRHEIDGKLKYSFFSTGGNQS
jgi:hypothetical protein